MLKTYIKARNVHDRSVIDVSNLETVFVNKSRFFGFEIRDVRKNDASYIGRLF